MSTNAREGATGRELRGFKPYVAYKDSGVEWLKTIPTHWRQKRLRFLVRVSPPKSEVHELERHQMVSFVPMEAVGEYGGLELEITKPLGSLLEGYTYFRDGDVLVAKITPRFENGKGALAAALEGGVGFGTTELHVLRAGPELDSRFLFYLSLSDHFRRLGTAAMYGAGGQKRVPEDYIRDLRHPFPDLPEQRCIVTFLDRKTARIDALVAEKERLIGLLEEQRAAHITRAVTRGLDPKAPMKDSGAAWLGQVPAHWDFQRIKWVARMESGHTPDRKIAEYWTDGDIPWVSLADTALLRETDYVADTAVRTTTQGIAHSSARVLPPGTVVFSRDATIGLSAITAVPMAVSQHFIGWVCGDRLVPQYLLFVLRSMTQELDRLTMGATVKTIGMPDVKGLATPIPPLEEQRRIVAFAREQRSRLNALLSKAQDAVTQLREYRTALISAAVTGTIDVRKEVA